MTPDADTLAYRRALGCFATGVAVIVAPSGVGLVGITVNSFTSVSLNPRLVLWCLDDASDRYDVFAGAETWGVSVLAADDAGRSSRFAGGGEAVLAPNEAHRLSDGGLALAGGLARLSCRTERRFSIGDHLVIVGAVAAFESGAGAGLTYFRGRYGVAEEAAG